MGGIQDLPSLRGLGVVVWSDDGQVLASDERFAQLLGTSPEALVGTSYWDWSAPGQKQRVLNHLLSGQGACEQDLVRADGSTLTVQLLGGAQTHPGQQRRWIAYAQPATAQDSHEATAQAMARALRHQNAILLKLAQEPSIDEGHLELAMQAVTEACARGLGCARSSVWLYNEDASQILCMDLFEATAGAKHSQGASLNASDFPGYFRALAEDRTIAADDAHQHPATCEFSQIYLAPLGITSMLEAPIRKQGQLIGVLCNEHIGPQRAFSQEEQHFAASVADYVGRALQAHERARADQAIRELNAQLEQRVQERTAALQMTLDSMGDGLLVCDMSGALLAERSRAVEGWFGPLPVGQPLWSYLAADDPTMALTLELAWSELVEDLMPRALLLDQLPKQLKSASRTFSLDWHPVEDARGDLDRMVLVARDITDKLAVERAHAAQRELPHIVSHVVRDRAGFAAFVDEIHRLLDDLSQAQASMAERLRAAHDQGQHGHLRLRQLRAGLPRPGGPCGLKRHAAARRRRGAQGRLARLASTAGRLHGVERASGLVDDRGAHALLGAPARRGQRRAAGQGGLGLAHGARLACASPLGDAGRAHRPDLGQAGPRPGPRS